MTTLTHEILHELCLHRDETCVSLYLPHQEERQHPTAFKNLLREAKKGLAQAGLSTPEAEALLAPGYELLGDVWSLQGRNLAWFASAAGARLLTLDFPIEEQLWVQPRFSVKPLFWLDLYRQPFYVLVVSLQGARLLDCTAAREAEIEIRSAPNPVDSLRAVEMAHAAGRAGHPAVQSHAARKELQKDIQQFIGHLARAVHRQLEARPVVLAGVEELTSLYRKAHTREDVPLAEGSLAGAADDVPPARLRERAWELAAPFFKAERREALARLAQSQVQHGPSTVRIDEMVRAAGRGQIETLLLPSGLQVMGRVDPHSLDITINSSLEDAIDLLDYCAAETCAHRGRVHLFEPGTLPRPGAMFRAEPSASCAGEQSQ